MEKPIKKHCNSGRNYDARMDRNCLIISTRNSYTKNTVNIDIDKIGDRLVFHYLSSFVEIPYNYLLAVYN